jgi:DNA-binding transcriptional ArsR family regulator
MLLDALGPLSPSPLVDRRGVYDNHLVMNSTAQLDATFAALGDPTRRAILQRLAHGDASVTELAEPFSMSQPAISKHLRVLERAGLVARGRGGHRRACKLVGKPLKEANAWLENYRQFWEATYVRLDVLLAEMKSVQRRKK